MLATEIFDKISVASMRTHGRGEEAQLSSGWILIGSELSSLNFNSSVRAEQSFAIRYPNVVIYFRSQIATKSERCIFGLCFSVAFLSSLADFRARECT